jgi:hypothetical protein
MALLTSIKRLVQVYERYKHSQIETQQNQTRLFQRCNEIELLLWRARTYMSHFSPFKLNAFQYE